MADSAIADFTAGGTAQATDRIAAARSPFGAGDDRYLTPVDIAAYIRSLANTFTATQTVTPAVNTSAFTATGYSLTGANAQSLLDYAGTWNTSGTPTALKINITDTASNTNSLLQDLQIGGSSKHAIRKDGAILGPTGALMIISAATGQAIQIGNADGRPLSIGSASIGLTTSASFNWNGDLILLRDAANTLALRNSTSAQVLNSYYSYTDASNFQRAALKTASANIELAAESLGTGAANIDVKLTPKGTGVLQYGTHSALTAETVTGYITIKDSGGTTRKLAVVS